MRTIAPEDLREIRGKSADFYESWLAEGCKKYALAQGRYAFPGGEHFINQTDSLTGDLAEIARELDESDRAAFARGCVKAIEMLPLADKSERFAADTLMRLCAHLKAVEAIPVVRAMLETGKFAGESASLDYLARELIRDLS